MSRKVLHKSWMKENAFGGITTTTQCRRVDNSGVDYNVADTDEEVTCKFCLAIMNAGKARPDAQWGEA